MANKSYLAVEKKLSFAKLEKGIVDYQKKWFGFYARNLVEGYQEIVSNWESDVKPTFRSEVVFNKQKQTIYVRIYMGGSKKAKMVFRLLDEGASRGQVVKAPIGTPHDVAKETQLGRPLLASTSKPPTKPAEVYVKKDGRYVMREDLQPKWVEYERDKKRYASEQRKLRKAVKKSAARMAKKGPGRTRKGSRLGIQTYKTKTGTRGRIGGPGQAASGKPTKSRQRPQGGDPNWRGHGQPKSVKLGKIRPRHWTLSLKLAMAGETGGTATARKIWGQKLALQTIASMGFEGFNNLPR